MDMAIRTAPGRGRRRSWARSLGDPNWRVLAGFTFATIAVLLSGGRTFAADASNGLLLARGWCSSCHLVEPSGRASDVAPPFEAIARDPATTPEGLRGWLTKPHPPMPDLKLSRGEEDDILAYILSLKTP
jgi:mono/diheme cytochrome c family protein